MADKAETKGAQLVVAETGEVVDFEQVARTIEGMSIDEKAQAFIALVDSKLLSNIIGTLKNSVIDYMLDNDAKIMPLVGGEIELTSSVSYDYNTKTLESMPECKDAITYPPKIDKRVLNKVMKLGGKVKQDILDAITTKEPKYNLKYNEKMTAQVED